jgi:hypothetical protein
LFSPYIETHTTNFLQIGLALEDIWEHILIVSTEAYIIGSYLKGLSRDTQIINMASGVIEGRIINKVIEAIHVG